MPRALRGNLIVGQSGGPTAVINNSLVGVIREALAHEPTLVVYQPGSVEIARQFRRRTYDFTAYPQTLDRFLKRLCGKGVRVIACSVIPKGESGSLEQLTPTNDGLRTWVEAAREAARRHDAPFVDLFSQAVTWRMISNAKTYYGAKEHQKSWELFASQLRFVSDAPFATVDAKTGRTRAHGAVVRDLKLSEGGTQFILACDVSAGPMELSVQNLPSGDYSVSLDDRPWRNGTAPEIAAGIDVAAALSARSTMKELHSAIESGYKITADAASVASYTVPSWVKAPDFEQQKRAELRRVRERLAAHDETLREMVAARPLRVAITLADTDE